MSIDDQDKSINVLGFKGAFVTLLPPSGRILLVHRGAMDTDANSSFKNSSFKTWIYVIQYTSVQTGSRRLGMNGFWLQFYFDAEHCCPRRLRLPAFWAWGLQDFAIGI